MPAMSSKVTVWVERGCLCFEIDGVKYHFTFSSATNHISTEKDRDHYGFEVNDIGQKDKSTETVFIDKQMTRQEKGTRGDECHVFSKLPNRVKLFLSKNYSEIRDVKDKQFYEINSEGVIVLRLQK